MLILVGCSSLQKKTPAIQSPDWYLTAKVLVKPESGKRESIIVQWKKQADTFKINAFNSFSQPLMSLYSTTGYARMDVADGRMMEAASVEQLMQSNLGWSVPTGVFSYWLQGDLIGSEREIVREDERLSSFTYEGFIVNLSQYRNFGTVMAPGRITLQNSQFTLVIVVKSYELFQDGEASLSG